MSEGKTRSTPTEPNSKITENTIQRRKIISRLILSNQPYRQASRIEVRCRRCRIGSGRCYCRKKQAAWSLYTQFHVACHFDLRASGESLGKDDAPPGVMPLHRVLEDDDVATHCLSFQIGQLWPAIPIQMKPRWTPLTCGASCRLSILPSSAQYRWHRAQQNQQIQFQRLVLQVIKIHLLQRPADVAFTFPAHLPQAGQPRFDRATGTAG